jgi:hypothetical protein
MVTPIFVIQGVSKMAPNLLRVLKKRIEVWEGKSQYKI